MKKGIVFVLCSLLCLSMVGCSKQGETLDMDYISFGSGEKSFVILPGLSIHSVMNLKDAIEDAYKDFTDEYTVYVFDRAKNIESGYSIEDMARDTAAKMESLGIQDAYVFGASQGGMIAECLAIQYPKLVHAMILGSTLAKANDTFNKVVDTWIDLAEKKDEDALLESFVNLVYSKATVDAYHDTLISSNKGITDEEYERFIILASACKDFDCFSKLKKIKCPVLVLGSEGDQIVTAQGSKQIAKALNCEIYLYDSNYGHGVYDEASDYKQRCLDFFDSVDE